MQDVFTFRFFYLIDPLEPLKPDFISGCIVEYQYVEIVQAGLQAILAVSKN